MLEHSLKWILSSVCLISLLLIQIASSRADTVNGNPRTTPISSAASKSDSPATKTSVPTTDNPSNAPTSQATSTEVVTPAVEEQKFDVLELRVKGNHLLKNTEIERTIYPFLGPQKNLDDVEKARNALEMLYHDKGYQTVSVDIPEQEVNEGVINLLVIEGKVARLRVTGSKYFTLGKIKEGVPELAEGNVPNFPVMQKQIEALSNKSPDRSITPILRAGDTPGTMEADLKVNDELPLHGRVELNGRNTSSTSRLRLVNSIHYDNLWQQFHSASLMYQVAPENSDEVEVWAGTYALPLSFIDDKTKLALYAVSSSSNASLSNAGALAVIGIGDIYGLRLIRALPDLDSFNHSLTLGVDYKDFKEDLQLIGADTIRTPISYLPFLVEYSASFFGDEWKASVTTGINFAVRGLVSNSNFIGKNANGENIIAGEFETKRAFAKPNYAYLTLDANASVKLPYDSLLTSRFSGQVADSPLISNEQFSLGGMQSVRGYFETQALADDGFTASLELRSPDLTPSQAKRYVDNIQALWFVDGGYGSVQQPLPSVKPSNSLASTGLGVRFQLLKYLDGILDLGFPLIDLNSVKAGNPKLHFSIAAEF